MAYATQADIITLYSEDALYVADRDGDGLVDDTAVTRALTLASSEIDSYVGVRHTLPIDPVPGLLVQFSVDIALYRLAMGRDVLSEEHRQRYEDAIKHLERIARGTASLNLPGPIDPETGEAAHTSPRPIVVGGPPREFTRDKMRGL